MRLGVIGSFVWDVIHGRDPVQRPIEEWGGITYALSGFDAALPDDWQVVPLAKVGSDLWPRARQFLATLRRLAPDAEPIQVNAPNNRVRLEYTSDELRSEVMQGGVPPWEWSGLSPLLRNLDALYVNLLSGFELDLETMQLIRRHFRGPIYCDLHSLFLGIHADGTRFPRPISTPEAWFECADFVQVNESEMSMMAPDPMALAARAMGTNVRSLVVTLGKRGAVYVVAPGFETLADLRKPPAFGAVRTALLPAEPAAVNPGDPTGCGDVLGATYFSRLLAGDTFGVALRAGIHAASRNVAYRGAAGLASYLRGELLRT